jgi:luciferase family oxidoreductase group 1
MTAFSVLDLSPIVEGGDARRALLETTQLARAAERLGYTRFWLAEHHNMPGIASAATAVVIGHIAGGTSRIRVGAGGIMLPNHSPLVVAEQFGTLESLYPDRIDLGIGRAPGTDPRTTMALRRQAVDADETFPRDLAELQRFFAPAAPGQPVRAVPGAGLAVPIWLLGSSLFSAELAAALGLPFAFASHFAPDYLLQAIELYRTRFRPSDALVEPYVMAGIAVFAADTDAEARRMLTSAQLQFLNLRRGMPGQLPPPIDSFEAVAAPAERAGVEHAMRYAAIGSPETVAERIRAFLDLTHVDELIVTSQIYDHAARLRSYELLGGIRG